MLKQVKLHSAYNPQKEAERFCAAIQSNPKIIVITEPGESYIAPILRTQFPSAKLIAIRYTDTYFLQSDILWDAVWRPVHGNLDFFIIHNIPDEFLCVSIFLPWKPAELVWKESADFVWKTIAASVKIIQSVIATRDFFGQRWFKNITDNFLFAEHLVNFEFKNTDSVFAASGGSLAVYLKQNKNGLNKRFILAASSAVPALIEYGISPALCLSTDGGFWAGGHLKRIPEHIPVCFPPEAKIPYTVLKKNPCVFLTYNSLPETLFFTDFEIIPKKAVRNGTVSGTGVELLLDYTKGNIYAAGLDLEGSKGFPHTQPHESLKSKETAFSKLNPVSQFAAVSNFDTRSLEIYAKWFSQIPAQRACRIFRLGNKGRDIENIKRISFERFDETAEQNPPPPSIHYLPKKSKLDKKIIVYEFYKNLQKKIDSGLFLTEIKSGIQDVKQKKIENELASLISFQSYIKYIKEEKTKNTAETEQQLKDELTAFIRLQIKRLKND